MTTTTTVAVYCRISNDPARLEVGVTRQRADCAELVARLWPDARIKVFADNNLSAANPDVERPQWRAMLDALRSGDVDQVVAYDQSRLTRQPLEWEHLLVVLGRRGIASIHTVREGERDLADGGGRMVSRIIAAVDAEYAEVTRVRIRRAMRQLAAEGRPVGGRIFGYVSAIGADGRKTRAIVPVEADAIQWAAQQLLQGATLGSVAQAFASRGLTHTKKGKEWTRTHIRSLVTNTSVAGLRRDPEGNLITAIWPPILDESTWRSVKAVLTQPVTLMRSDGVPYRTTRKRRLAQRHLLSGLAACGRCGAPLTAQVIVRRSGAVAVNYICDPRLGRVCVGIVGHYLERCVVEALFLGFADPATRLRLSGPRPAEVIAISQELDDVDADLAALARLWGGGQLTRGEWAAAREGLAVRAESLRSRLGVLSIPTFDAATVAERWPDMVITERRSIVAAAFERIEVLAARTTLYDPGRIALVWRNNEAQPSPLDAPSALMRARPSPAASGRSQPLVAGPAVE